MSIEELRDQMVQMTQLINQLKMENESLAAGQAKNDLDNEKKIEKMVLQQTMGSKYFSLDPKPFPGKLLEKFSSSDLTKFKATDNPRDHLLSFVNAMNLKGVDKSMYLPAFPLSLEHVPLKWYYHQDPKLATTTKLGYSNALLDNSFPGVAIS